MIILTTVPQGGVHLLLSNIDAVLDGKPAKMPVSMIVSEEDYDKAMRAAKKVFDKEQFETLDSETPVYDS